MLILLQQIIDTKREGYKKQRTISAEVVLCFFTVSINDQLFFIHDINTKANKKERKDTSWV